MTWALVTGATGEHTKLLDVGRPSMLTYAKRWGMAFIEADLSGDLPPSWLKIPAMIDALESHEGALWVDADAMFVRDDVWIGDCCTKPWNWVYHRYAHWDRAYPTPLRVVDECPNAGVLAVRRDGITLLDRVWDRRYVFASHVWWEQGAAHELFGWSGERITRFAGVTEWTHLQGELAQDWNSAPMNPQPDPIIAHFCGEDFGDRLRAMKALRR